jgi:hypothetical protein
MALSEGLMAVTCPVKWRSPKAATLAETLIPALIRPASFSGICRCTLMGLMRTMVAITVVGETYSPTAVARALT